MLHITKFCKLKILSIVHFSPYNLQIEANQKITNRTMHVSHQFNL
jgi:hypothetical protein